MPGSGRSAVIGYGRQTAPGTPLTSPKYEVAMGGGSAAPGRSTTEFPWTAGTQDATGFYVNLISGAVQGVQVPVLPVSAVPLFQAVQGARVTTGAGPYSHIMTPADALPSLSFFYQQPYQAATNPNYVVVSDVNIGTATLSWAPGSPLTLQVDGMGVASTRAATKWTAATLAEPASVFYTYVNAVLKADAGATPATTLVHNVQSGSITWERNLVGLQTDGIGYYAIAPQKRDITVQLADVVLEDNAFLNTLYYGTPTGTTQSTASGPPTGSLDITFLLSDGTAAAAKKLQVSVPNIVYNVAQLPQADPSGAPAVYTIDGNGFAAVGGTSSTVTVLNADAGTNY